MMNATSNRGRLQSVTAGAILLVCGLSAQAQQTTTAPTPASPAAKTAEAELKPFSQPMPPSAYSIEMLPVPGSDDGKIKPFYLGKTEITWEAMDVFVYRLDEEKGDNPPGVDAVTRPSKPYIPPDRGFGHEGYAAISVSFKNANAFCEWLSARTGRHYRLPTEAEWELAARAGGSGDYGAGIDAAHLGEYAWLVSNSNDSPKEAGKRKPNAWGFYDIFGNAREWVVTAEGKPTTKGGSYQDAPDLLKVSAKIDQTPEWNASDPQVPKSKWWLSDSPFAGFRIVCEAGPGGPAGPAGPRQDSTDSNKNAAPKPGVDSKPTEKK